MPSVLTPLHGRLLPRFALTLLAAGILAAPAARAQDPSPFRGRADTLRLSLEDAVARAERHGDISRTAAIQMELTEAQLAIARAGALPSLRVSGGYTRVYRSARGQVVGRLFQQPNTYTISGTFSQPIFQGGRVFRGIRAAGFLRQAAREAEEDAKRTAALDAQRAYLAVLLSGRLAEIQRTNLILASDRVTQVERLETSGRVARYDVLRARVERANVEPLVLEAENQRDIALLELKELLDIPLDQPVELTSRIDGETVRLTLASLGSDTTDAAAAAEARPSVRAAELTARARRDAIAIARADYLPNLSLFIAGGYQAFPERGLPPIAGRFECTGPPTPTAPCTNVQNGGFFSDFSGGVQLTWNVFDGFRTHANVNLAQAQARLADLQYQQERQLATLEIARAQAELGRARSFYAARQQAATESRETFRLASLRYNRGLGTQLDVSDAQLAQLTAESNEARAAYDLHLAAAELARALGRPVPLPPRVPVPIRASSTTDVP